MMRKEKGMNGIEAVREALARSGFTQADLARSIGYEGDYPAQFASKMLKARKNMDMDRAAAILGAIGYEVVLVPKGSKIPQSGISVACGDPSGYVDGKHGGSDD